MWAVALVASGLIFTYGMTTINGLAATDHAGAVSTWRAVEPVALCSGRRRRRTARRPVGPPREHGRS